MKRFWGLSAVLVLGALLPVNALAAVGRAAVGGASASVVLTEPPAGTKGHPLWDSYYDLTPFGYTETEFFVSGTASDAADNPAAFTTRIIVTHPVSADDFNGTVVLDWVNVTAQFENAVDTMLAREMLMREGFAYVHVSAQEAGICCTPLTPQTWDPVRYADLAHPGDAWSFDMFTQIAAAFEQPPQGGSLDPMGALGFGSVDQVIAMGQSQSGIRLYEYLNEWLPAHPAHVGIIDGFLVHGNIGQPKTFDVPIPVPVLNLLSDLEAVDDGIDPRADLDPNVRVWEIAGSAHADLFIGYQSEFGHGPRVLTGADKVDRAGFEDIIREAGNYGEQLTPLFAVCTAAGAAFPMHYAASTAIFVLDRWVRGGDPPEHGPRYTFEAGALARDADGNALGGIRLPPIDVPVAEYRSTDCQLGGTTRPFTEVELLGRYGDFAAYHAAMVEHTDASVRAGHLLPADAVDLMTRVCAASVRFLEPDAECPAYTPPPFGVAAPAGGSGNPVDTTAPSVEPSAAPGGQTLPVTGDRVSLILMLAAALLGLAVRAGSRQASRVADR